MRKLLIEEAPVKELIAPIQSTGDTQALRAYIKARLAWHKYPLIHDDLVTYSIFADLNIEALSEEASSTIFNYLLNSIADDLSDTELSAWVFLLFALKDKKSIESLTGRRAVLDALLPIEERIINRKDKDGNLSYWFCQLRNFIHLSEHN